MHIARKLTYLGVALGASVALAAASFQIAAQAGTPASAVSSTQVSSPAVAALDKALDSVAFPAGTSVEKSVLNAATAPALLVPPSDVVVTPVGCSELLSSAVGGLSNLTGTLQRGITSSNGKLDKLAAQASQGVDLAKLRATAKACNFAKVTVRSLGLTGVLTFTELAGPSVAGADSVAIKQTLVIAGSSQLAKTVAAAGSSVQTYVGTESEIIAVCGGDILATNTMAAGIYQALAS